MRIMNTSDDLVGKYLVNATSPSKLCDTVTVPTYIISTVNARSANRILLIYCIHNYKR